MKYTILCMFYNGIDVTLHERTQFSYRQRKKKTLKWFNNRSRCVNDTAEKLFQMNRKHNAYQIGNQNIVSLILARIASVSVSVCTSIFMGLNQKTVNQKLSEEKKKKMIKNNVKVFFHFLLDSFLSPWVARFFMSKQTCLSSTK